ncbi:MAG: iron-sulfur cluster insertion protein ErpA [Pseudomonadota bacterium]
MADAVTTERSGKVELTESAAQRIVWLISQQENKGLMLRISVSGGGCSGFQYGFAFDDTKTETDLKVERDGAVVLIDEVSLDLLNGAHIEYVEDLIGSAFSIKNPQAKSSCGCGNSFSV